MRFWHHPLIKNIGPIQFGSLFSTTLISAIGTVFNASILAIALLTDIGWQEVALWWSSIAACSSYAIYGQNKNKNKSPKTTSRRAIKKLVLMAVIFALP